MSAPGTTSPSTLRSNLRSNLRSLNRHRRRDAIVDAACRIIIKDGVDGLSMRPLADAAGVAVRTLYNHFANRDAILAEISDRAMDRMDAAFAAAAPLSDPIARARAVVTVSIRHVLAEADLFKPMLLAQPLNAHPGGPHGRRAGHMQGVALAAAMDQGLLERHCDPELLGLQVYHGWELAALHWAQGRIDAATFEARALHGLYVALLAVATDCNRSAFASELRRIEAQLTITDDPAKGQRNGTGS